MTPRVLRQTGSKRPDTSDRHAPLAGPTRGSKESGPFACAIAFGHIGQGATQYARWRWGNRVTCYPVRPIVLGAIG